VSSLEPSKEPPKLLRVPERFNSLDECLACARAMRPKGVLVLMEMADDRLCVLDYPDMSLSDVNWLLDRMKFSMWSVL
jgi:hypothetical protein